MRHRAFATMVVLCSLCGCSYAQGGPESGPLGTLAQELALRLVGRDQPRLAVLDFTDLQGRTNVLGRYLAETIDVRLANTQGMTVMDRRNTARIMEEHQLTAEGLIDPENAKKLGHFAGVDSILIGSFALTQDHVELITKAISTETSEILAASQVSLPVTEDFRLWARTAITGIALPQAGMALGDISSEEPMIAIRDIGPITVVLRNVMLYQPQQEGDGPPALRCTFEFENRDLSRWVAIAVPQRLEESDVRRPLDAVAYRGTLTDSRSTSWELVDIKGVSAIACFEKMPSDYSITQMNPGGIVDYIRNGRMRDDSVTYYTGGQFWSGAFSSVPPGERIRMTGDFVPTTLLGRRSRSRQSTIREMPSHFQLDMELVLATYLEGEPPAKSKDMMLRNLTVDRVSPPTLLEANP